WLDVATDAGSRRIRIIRVHLEEDAGKSMHDEQGGGRDSRVDLNRAGTPLLEIVSHPDLQSPEEAKAYLEEIRLLMKNLEVSNCARRRRRIIVTFRNLISCRLWWTTPGSTVSRAGLVSCPPLRGRGCRSSTVCPPTMPKC